MEPNFISTNFEYKVWKFPSGEIQVRIESMYNYEEGDLVTIVGSIHTSDNIIELLQLVDCFRYLEPNARLQLRMPYCAYSRQDRRCNAGEALSIKVFANLINSCNFEKVAMLDNHSDVATALINNAISISVSRIVPFFLRTHEFDYLVSPDAGADKKVHELAAVTKLPVIHATKVRSTIDGTITDITINLPPNDFLKSAKLLIVDDICQGGRTFIELTRKLKEIEATADISLYVSHGFFSNGIQPLLDAGISTIFTTDSVYKDKHPNIVIYKGTAIL